MKPSVCRYDAEDWYDTPRLYDVIFRQGTAIEFRFLESMMERYGNGQRQQVILEPACGSGRLVEAALCKGYETWGFDLNKHMIAYAKARIDALAPSAVSHLWVAEMSQFSAPKHFTMAHALVSTFKYLLDDQAAVAFLRRVSDALVSGGIFILGLHLTFYDRSKRTVERWFGDDNGEQVICAIDSWQACSSDRLEKMRSRLSAISGKQKRYMQTNWNFRTYSHSELDALLAHVPSLKQVACYDFHHDADKPVKYPSSQTDVVLILRRT